MSSQEEEATAGTCVEDSPCGKQEKAVRMGQGAASAETKLLSLSRRPDSRR